MPGGFGTFGAGAWPAGVPFTPPGVTPTTLVSSWKIDPNAQRYVFDEDGNPLAMDGTDQRVYILVCEVLADPPPVVTPQTLRKQESDLRTALRPLVREGAISNLQINAASVQPGEALKSVTYTNNGTARAVTVRIR
jgi:hypothetical protein